MSMQLVVTCPECGRESSDVWLAGCCPGGHEPAEILRQVPEPEAGS
jgi:hypothetical protein